MGIFGWDLPPGCTSRDIEEAFGGDELSPESEEVFTLLEEAGVAQEIIDKVTTIVDELAGRECSACLKRQEEAEYRMEEEARKAEVKSRCFEI